MNKKELDEASKVISDFNTMLDESSGGTDIKMLEIRKLKSIINLSEQYLLSLKNEFKRNIFYVFLGGLIGFISSYTLTTFQSKSELQIIELSKLLTEKNEQQSDFQKHLNDMSIEILSLKKEIDSLKVQ